jgi:hypothetical protein
VKVFLKSFEQAGRRPVFHPESVDFLEAYIAAADDEDQSSTIRSIARLDHPEVLESIFRNPDRFVIEERLADFALIAQLLERAGPALPDGARPMLLHSGGFPLGTFDASWSTFETWKALLDIEYVPLGVWGHAKHEHIRRFIDAVQPKLVIPVHSRHPEEAIPPDYPAFLPEKGSVLELDGE